MIEKNDTNGNNAPDENINKGEKSKRDKSRDKSADKAGKNQPKSDNIGAIDGLEDFIEIFD